MISDVLSDAVREIDRYLADPVFAAAYQGDVGEKIRALRDEMDAMRRDLDRPPPAWELGAR